MAKGSDKKRKDQKVCLVNTPTLSKRPLSRSMAGGLGFDGSGDMVLPPLDLAIFASQLRESGYEVSIIDADPLGYDDDKVLAMVREGGFSTILATLSLPTLKNDCTFISRLKELVVAKVIVKTLINDREILSEILEKSGADFVVHGECDLNIHELIKGKSVKGTAFFKNGEFKLENVTPVAEMDKLPFPAWDLLPLDKYRYPLLGRGVMTMQTSRGCPFPCAYYCPYPLVEGNTWRSQSPERVFNEMNELVNKHGFRKILFRDATFTLNKERAHKICDMIIEKGLHLTWWCETRVDCLDDDLMGKMKQAGCAGMNIGVETGDQEVMKSQAKRGLTIEKLTHLRIKAKSIGLRLHFLFLMGLPNGTKRSVVDTYDLIMKLRPESLGITIITPYPGTPLFKEAKEKGWIDSVNWDDYGGHQLVMHTDNMTGDEISYGLKFLSMGKALIQKSYEGANPDEVREVERKVYNDLLAWAMDLGDLQNKLRHKKSMPGEQVTAVSNKGERALKLSVIIPTYNRKEQLLHCLEKLAHQDIDPSHFEVLVVDDGSTDGTGKVLKALTTPYSLKYYFQDNSGPAGARNFGVTRATNEIISFIGDDIIVTHGFVAEHLKAHQGNPDKRIAILGHIDWPPEFEVTSFMKYITGYDGQQFGFPGIKDRQNVSFHYFYTSNISLKRSFLLEEDYLFDRDFLYAACEDMELGYRLAKRGLRIIYHPEALVYHSHPIDLKSFLQREEKVGEMLVVLEEKHPELADPNFKAKKVVEADLLEEQAQREKTLEAIEELKTVRLSKLKPVTLNDENLEDRFLREILDPLYKFVLGQARVSGRMKRYKSTANGQECHLPLSDRKKVSIIIPVFNKVEYTKKCLEALAINTEGELFEVIIVGNASTDGTKEFLKCLGGDVKIITNDENRGFAKACNQGASAADGEYLLFLNNDTVPQKGWLEAMVMTIVNEPGVGIVGSKLLYPNGTVQHAGIVFYKDRNSITRINYIYKGASGDCRMVNHLRDFNAVTAACLLISKELFFTLDGFYEGFAAGYEDIDLCLRAKKKGYRIIYQPESSLIHHEEVTRKDMLSRGTEDGELLFKRNDISYDAEEKAREDGYTTQLVGSETIRYSPLITGMSLGSKRADLYKDGECKPSTEKVDMKKDSYYRQEREEVEAAIPIESKVILDVGCGEGQLGKSLLERGAAEVIGIELSPEVCDRAEKNISKVICGDVEALDPHFKEGYFDCIVFADILEHLKYPTLVLKKYKRYLKDSGCIVTSIPNVRYFRVINMLVEGYWSYGNFGILDRTHLRFFTKKEMEAMLEEAGFTVTGQIIQLDPAYNALDNQNQGDLVIGKAVLRNLTRDEIRDCFAWQYIMKAKKADGLSNTVESVIASGNLHRAKGMLEDHLKVHSTDITALQRYAELCNSLGLIDEANESLERVLLLEPDRLDAQGLRRKIDRGSSTRVVTNN